MQVCSACLKQSCCPLVPFIFGAGLVAAAHHADLLQARADEVAQAATRVLQETWRGGAGATDKESPTFCFADCEGLEA